MQPRLRHRIKHCHGGTSQTESELASGSHQAAGSWYDSLHVVCEDD